MGWILNRSASKLVSVVHDEAHDHDEFSVCRTPCRHRDRMRDHSGIIASRKNRDAAAFALLGFILGVVGVVIALVVSDGIPKAPPGWQSVRCVRCNTIQNIPAGDPFKCYQCGLE
ncbi:hypothetical protein FK529_13495 [Tsukamurella asaccharolytica]|uniref:Uncharacterized protein n=1 Tax=Tsukamurella asaccharolytica TaxID=2592067 RepID=A0A5C5RA48_9ACTN|nr:hypothetical protein [Tsukamurella asaccharolytica]TWS18981.1 hypothetical protein FK529_13495 [Tsukamurella asaccharolytica]